MQEIWKPIEGYSEIYEVSNTGKVRNSISGRLLKPMPCGFEESYHRVQLYRFGVREQFRIHRLVAIAFIPNPDNKPEVNHFDLDRTNNSVDNLEWMTGSENIIHSRFMRDCNKIEEENNGSEKRDKDKDGYECETPDKEAGYKRATGGESDSVGKKCKE